MPLLAGLACALALLPRPGRGEDAAHALAARVVDAAPAGPFVSDLLLTTGGGLERRLTMSGMRLPDGGAARYIEVNAPTNLQGTRYLLLERATGRDDRFLYVPTMQRVMRLAETTLREPFLGSTFYVADLVRPALDDFRYAFAGDATVLDRPCRLVEARPREPESQVYGRSVFAIDPAALVVLEIRLYDADDALLKVLHVEDLERREGYWTAVRQRMVNVQTDETSTLVVERIDYDAAVAPETFTVGHIGR